MKLTVRQGTPITRCMGYGCLERSLSFPFGNHSVIFKKTNPVLLHLESALAYLLFFRRVRAAMGLRGSVP